MLGKAILGALLTLAAVGSGCSADDDRLVVFAASSLTEGFEEIEIVYEAANPDVDVVMSFGGSSSLVVQLESGAPAAVLATADLATMQRAVADESVVGQLDVFATNTLVVAVEQGNPLEIDELSDLADVTVVLAAPQVPVGAYSQQVLVAAGVELQPVSYEQNVRAVLSKVALGEADAGLVYRTDVMANDDTDAVLIPDDINAEAEYLVAAVSDSPDAYGFIGFLLGDEAGGILRNHGFGTP